MSDIEILKSSFDAWDTVALWTGVVGFVALLGQFIAEFTSAVENLGAWLETKFKLGVDWESSIKRALVLLVIASAGTQIVAQLKIAAASSQIVAFLDDKAGAANKRAGEANERAGAANKLAGEANERASEANERAGKAHVRAAALEVAAEELKKENLVLTAQMRGIGIQIGDRGVNDKERAQLAEALKGKSYSVTVVMIDEREARQYALAISDALRKAGAKVRREQIPSTSETGVIVCDATKRGIALLSILRRVAIISKVPGKKETRPEVCDRMIVPPAAPSTGLQWVADGLFGTANEPAETARGTVILVGQKRRL